MKRVARQLPAGTLPAGKLFAGTSLAGMLVIGALIQTSCISVQWTRSTLDESIPDERIASFSIGESSLHDALDVMGAPLYVWELPRGHAALAWGWFGMRDWGLKLSVPTEVAVDPSFQYNDIDNSLEGFVFVFDGDERLTLVRRGYLAEIADDLRRRPSFDVGQVETQRED